MKITVIGKAHLKGTSKKSGNDYDFIQVHYNAPARGVDGLASKTCSLDPQFYDVNSIRVGSEYNIDFDERGYVVGFTPVEKH